MYSKFRRNSTSAPNTVKFISFVEFLKRNNKKQSKRICFQLSNMEDLSLENCCVVISLANTFQNEKIAQRTDLTVPLIEKILKNKKHIQRIFEYVPNAEKFITPNELNSIVAVTEILKEFTLRRLMRQNIRITDKELMLNGNLLTKLFCVSGMEIDDKWIKFFRNNFKLYFNQIKSKPYINCYKFGHTVYNPYNVRNILKHIRYKLDPDVFASFRKHLGKTSVCVLICIDPFVDKNVGRKQHAEVVYTPKNEESRMKEIKFIKDMTNVKINEVLNEPQLLCLHEANEVEDNMANDDSNEFIEIYAEIEEEHADNDAKTEKTITTFGISQNITNPEFSIKQLNKNPECTATEGVHPLDKIKEEPIEESQAMQSHPLHIYIEPEIKQEKNSTSCNFDNLEFYTDQEMFKGPNKEQYPLQISNEEPMDPEVRQEQSVTTHFNSDKNDSYEIYAVIDKDDNDEENLINFCEQTERKTTAANETQCTMNPKYFIKQGNTYPECTVTEAKLPLDKIKEELIEEPQTMSSPSHIYVEPEIKQDENSSSCNSDDLEFYIDIELVKDPTKSQSPARNSYEYHVDAEGKQEEKNVTNCNADKNDTYEIYAEIDVDDDVNDEDEDREENLMKFDKQTERNIATENEIQSTKNQEYFKNQENKNAEYTAMNVELSLDQIKAESTEEPQAMQSPLHIYEQLDRNKDTNEAIVTSCNYENYRVSEMSEKSPQNKQSPIRNTYEEPIDEAAVKQKTNAAIFNTKNNDTCEIYAVIDEYDDDEILLNFEEQTEISLTTNNEAQCALNKKYCKKQENINLECTATQADLQNHSQKLTLVQIIEKPTEMKLNSNDTNADKSDKNDNYEGHQEVFQDPQVIERFRQQKYILSMEDEIKQEPVETFLSPYQLSTSNEHKHLRTAPIKNLNAEVDDSVQNKERKKAEEPSEIVTNNESNHTPYIKTIFNYGEHLTEERALHIGKIFNLMPYGKLSCEILLLDPIICTYMHILENWPARFSERTLRMSFQAVLSGELYNCQNKYTIRTEDVELYRQFVLLVYSVKYKFFQLIDIMKGVFNKSEIKNILANSSHILEEWRTFFKKHFISTLYRKAVYEMYFEYTLRYSYLSTVLDQNTKEEIKKTIEKDIQQFLRSDVEFDHLRQHGYNVYVSKKAKKSPIDSCKVYTINDLSLNRIFEDIKELIPQLVVENLKCAGAEVDNLVVICGDAKSSTENKISRNIVGSSMEAPPNKKQKIDENRPRNLTQNIHGSDVNTAEIEEIANIKIFQTGQTSNLICTLQEDPIIAMYLKILRVFYKIDFAVYSEKILLKVFSEVFKNNNNGQYSACQPQDLHLYSKLLLLYYFNHEKYKSRIDKIMICFDETTIVKHLANTLNIIIEWRTFFNKNVARLLYREAIYEMLYEYMQNYEHVLNKKRIAEEILVQKAAEIQSFLGCHIVLPERWLEYFSFLFESRLENQKFVLIENDLHSIYEFVKYRLNYFLTDTLSGKQELEHEVEMTDEIPKETNIDVFICEQLGKDPIIKKYFEISNARQSSHTKLPTFSEQILRLSFNEVFKNCEQRPLSSDDYQLYHQLLLFKYSEQCATIDDLSKIMTCFSVPSIRKYFKNYVTIIRKWHTFNANFLLEFFFHEAMYEMLYEYAIRYWHIFDIVNSNKLKRKSEEIKCFFHQTFDLPSDWLQNFYPVLFKRVSRVKKQKRKWRSHYDLELETIYENIKSRLHFLVIEKCDSIVSACKNFKTTLRLTRNEPLKQYVRKTGGTGALTNRTAPAQDSGVNTKVQNEGFEKTPANKTNKNTTSHTGSFKEVCFHDSRSKEEENTQNVPSKDSNVKKSTSIDNCITEEIIELDSDDDNETTNETGALTNRAASAQDSDVYTKVQNEGLEETPANKTNKNRTSHMGSFKEVCFHDSYSKKEDTQNVLSKVFNVNKSGSIGKCITEEIIELDSDDDNETSNETSALINRAASALDSGVNTKVQKVGLQETPAKKTNKNTSPDSHSKEEGEDTQNVPSKDSKANKSSSLDKCITEEIIDLDSDDDAKETRKCIQALKQYLKKRAEKKKHSGEKRKKQNSGTTVIETHKNKVSHQTKGILPTVKQYENEEKPDDILSRNTNYENNDEEQIEFTVVYDDDT